jgi:DNA invertase Pin-like site-specific DNA recombinase
MNEKVGRQHLSRMAMLYVRQSSPYQVIRNEQSRLLQYAMKERLHDLGWTEVEIVDDDLGQSAAGSVQRCGFERMVSQVCLGKIGAVAAREVSRFARNSREWQQLVEVCRMVDTLLIDHDTIYDARRSNDRLLLGLKGSLNEYELDLLRLRSLEARREKASRGELIVNTPVGYIKSDEGLVQKDPDLRVQQSLQLLFQKALQLGSARQVLMWLIEHGLQVPTKRYRAKSWQTVWRRPSYRMVLAILRNPIYAGAYAYGKTEVKVEFTDGKMHKKVKRKPLHEWTTLIYDHHEGYIDREQFDRIQQMISDNSLLTGPGAPKKGPALLAGLLRCQRCGRILSVRYTGRTHTVLRYICCRGDLDNAEPRCIGIGGDPVDEAVSQEILKVAQPAAIEAAAAAAEKTGSQQDDIISALELELQAARYTQDRARRQFDAVDPANRLVADELEHRWELSLQKVRQLEERVQEAYTQRQQILPPDLKVFENLAADLDRVWNHPETDVRLKKRIVRTLIEEILVDVDSDAGETSLVIRWKGGIHTELRVRRRRRGQNRFHTPPDIVKAVDALTRICTDRVIAGVLNRNGLLTGKGNRWTQQRVTSLRSKRKIKKHSAERQKREGWMNLTQAAAYSGVSSKTLRRAVERGVVKACHPLFDGPWIFKRENLDSPSARSFIDRVLMRGYTPTGQVSKQKSLFKSTTYLDGAV